MIISESGVDNAVGTFKRLAYRLHAHPIYRRDAGFLDLIMRARRMSFQEITAGFSESVTGWLEDKFREDWYAMVFASEPWKREAEGWVPINEEGCAIGWTCSEDDEVDCIDVVYTVPVQNEAREEAAFDFSFQLELGGFDTYNMKSMSVTRR